MISLFLLGSGWGMTLVPTLLEVNDAGFFVSSFWPSASLSWDQPRQMRPFLFRDAYGEAKTRDNNTSEVLVAIQSSAF